MTEESKEPDTSDEPPSDAVNSHKAWVRYRTETFDGRTGEILHQDDSREPKLIELQGDNDPIFEVITAYRAREADTVRGGSESSVARPALGSAPLNMLRLYSPAIINALQSVVQYYPGQDLLGTKLLINWPYSILVHHYAELRDFKNMCENKVLSELCVRERDASEHIDLLLDFLDKNIMERVRAEKERLKRGYYTFENYWVHCKPGRTIVNFTYSGTNESQWEAYVVSELTGGIFHHPPSPWIMRGWSLAYNGTWLGRKKYISQKEPFDGELDASRQFFIDVMDEFDDDNDVVRKLVLDGEKYWKLLQKQCVYHDGKTVTFPHNEVK